MAELLHFIASWAEPICAEHRPQVSAAADELGLAVREVDVDQVPELARRYSVRGVPAVAITGDTGSVIMGARQADELMRLLRPHPRPFTAMVWLLKEPNQPPRRRELMAGSHEAAKALLVAEFGEDIDVVLTDEEAAHRPRGSD